MRRPVLLLARELCAFSFFETANLPSNRRRQAARIYARTASPYLIGGSALTRCGNDFGIWWWDLERIKPHIADRYGRSGVTLQPETLAQPIGTDWRIVRHAQGQEAQLWRNKSLVASVWHRTPFDTVSWAAFSRLQRNAPSAPLEPPPSQPLPYAAGSKAFSVSYEDLSREQVIGMALGSLAMIIGCLVAFWLGQGLQLDRDRSALEKETASILAATPEAEQMRALVGKRRTLGTYRQIEARTNPVGAAGAAIGIVAFHDLTPLALEATELSLTLTLPYSAVEVAEALVTDFEDSGFFSDIEPRTDVPNQRLVFEMSVLPSVRPLAPAVE
jgi:hypothetical protein